MRHKLLLTRKLIEQRGAIPDAVVLCRVRSASLGDPAAPEAANSDNSSAFAELIASGILPSLGGLR
jgi:hypothetical protein